MSKLFVSIISLLIFYFTQAQAADKDSIHRNLELGITAGINSTSISGYPRNINIGSDNFYLFGITGQYNFNNLFSLKSEIDFERKGFIVMSRPANSVRYPDLFDINYIHLNYLVVPVMAKLTFGPDNRFFVNAGPYFGFLLGAENTSSNLDSLGAWHIKTTNALNDYRHFDLGGSVGLGAELPVMHNFMLDLEGRYSLGLINNGFPQGSARNYALELVLGLRLKL